MKTVFTNFVCKAEDSASIQAKAQKYKDQEIERRDE
jgi:hypothetical protein